MLIAARRFPWLPGTPSKIAATLPPLGALHRVKVEGDDFVARCGERWSRRADGAVFPEHAGEVCAACEAAP